MLAEVPGCALQHMRPVWWRGSLWLCSPFQLCCLQAATENHWSFMHCVFIAGTWCLSAGAWQLVLGGTCQQDSSRAATWPPVLPLRGHCEPANSPTVINKHQFWPSMHLLHCLWGFRGVPWREKLLFCHQDSTAALCVLFSCGQLAPRLHSRHWQRQYWHADRPGLPLRRPWRWVLLKVQAAASGGFGSFI